MSFVRDLVGILLLGLGLLFAALGVFGLYRMPDVYTRMHATAKALVLGSSLILVGVAFLAPLELGLRALVTVAFVLITSPVATFASARAAHRRREPMTMRTVMDELEAARGGRRAEEQEPYQVD